MDTKVPHSESKPGTVNAENRTAGTEVNWLGTLHSWLTIWGFDIVVEEFGRCSESCNFWELPNINFAALSPIRKELPHWKGGVGRGEPIKATAE